MRPALALPSAAAPTISLKMQNSSKGCDRSDDQVVVGVLAVVEMEATQPVFVEQLRDDLGDVGPLGMMAGIHQHLGLRTQFLRHQERGAPVGQVGGVEGRLEELVLDQQPHTGRQIGIDRLKRFQQAMAATAQIILPGIVRAVCQPETDESRIHGLGDLDALAHMLDGLTPYPGLRVRQAAQAIDVILKQIGIDGANTQPKSLRFLSRGLPVVRLVPGNMQRDAGARAGHPLDHRGVRQLFVQSCVPLPARQRP